jgi:hypothetical protein
METCAERLPSRLVLCGSMTFFAHMRDLRDELYSHDVHVVLPDTEDDIGHYDARQYELFRRCCVKRHLRRVRSQRTFGILVANFNKNGIPDYIGPSTFAEIATAAATNKRIFILQDFPAVFKDVLADWEAVPLHGRLDPIVQLNHNTCILRVEQQLEMFIN